MEDGRSSRWWPAHARIAVGGDHGGLPRRREGRPADPPRTRGRDRRRTRRSGTSPSHLSLHQPFGFRGAHPVQPLRRAPQQRLPPLRDRARVLAGRAAPRASGSCASCPPPTASRRRPRRWPASSTRARAARGAGPAPGQLHPRRAVLCVRLRRARDAIGRCWRARARWSRSCAAASSTPGTSPAATSTPTTRGSSSATTAASPTASTAPASPIPRRSRRPPRRPAAGRRDQPYLDSRIHRPRRRG